MKLFIILFLFITGCNISENNNLKKYYQQGSFKTNTEHSSLPTEYSKFKTCVDNTKTDPRLKKGLIVHSSSSYSNPITLFNDWNYYASKKKQVTDRKESSYFLNINMDVNMNGQSFKVHSQTEEFYNKNPNPPYWESKTHYLEINPENSNLGEFNIECEPELDYKKPYESTYELGIYTLKSGAQFQAMKQSYITYYKSYTCTKTHQRSNAVIWKKTINDLTSESISFVNLDLPNINNNCYQTTLFNVYSFYTKNEKLISQSYNEITNIEGL